VHKQQKGFTHLLLLILTIAILGCTASVGYVVIKHQDSAPSYLTTPQPNVINKANGIGVKLYQPSYLPSGYVWYGIGLETAELDPADSSVLEGHMGKFAKVGQSSLVMQYIDTSDDLGHPNIFGIIETKSLSNFNPLTDCVTPVSINSTYPCQSIKSSSGIPIYYNQSMDIAFYSLGDTFVYIYGRPVTDIVNVLNSLKPKAVSDLGLLHPTNVPVEQAVEKKYPMKLVGP